MNEQEQSGPHPSGGDPLGETNAGSESVDESLAQASGGAESAAHSWPPTPEPSSANPASVLATGRGKFRSGIASRATAWAVAAGLGCAVLGLSIVVATTPSTPTSARFPVGNAPAGRLAPGAPFAGRFGVGTGGASGTVDSVSASSFTMTARSGQKLTVDEQTSTIYRSGSSTASASAVASGDRVFVLGSTSGSTVTATQVIILPTGGGGSGFSGALSS
jgi:hypothetical protein